MKTLALLTPHLLANLAPRKKEFTLHDAQCDGLALRVQPSGAFSWVMWERANKRTRRVTLGAFPDLAPEAARQRYRARVAGIAELQPSPHRTMEFGALCALFLRDKLPRYKPSTKGPFCDYLRRQLLPAFGNLEVGKIRSADIANWFHAYSRSKPGGANQALGHFTTIFNWGKAQGHLPYDLPNPTEPIRRNRRLARGRMLNSDQLKALWDVLQQPPKSCALAADPLKLVLLTGCRSGEIFGLTWKEVRGEKLALKDAKKGPREVPLNRPARQLLTALKEHRNSSFVFPSPLAKSGHIECLDFSWRKIRMLANLPPDFRIHDLRHTFASHAILSGETLAMTGALLGHRSPKSTQRYAHLDGSTLASAAEKVAARIEGLMG